MHLEQLAPICPTLYKEKTSELKICFWDTLCGSFSHTLPWVMHLEPLAPICPTLYMEKFSGAQKQAGIVTNTLIISTYQWHSKKALQGLPL
jgi:hypothetical protein